jgi:hypothetical protein
MGSENEMRHFHSRNLHEISNAEPHSLATVHQSDAATFSELSRRGFHLIDMSGPLWTLRRAA